MVALRCVSCLLLVVAFAGTGCSTRPEATPVSPEVAPAELKCDKPFFADVTATTGVQASCRNGEEADRFTILESLGSGCAVFDYDGDGRMDVLIVGGGWFEKDPGEAGLRGHPCKLFRNRGGMRFEDVTAAAGLDRPWWYLHGVAVADYDRDGFPDFVVTGYGRIELFHNESDGRGGRTFVAVAEKLGLKDASWSTSAGWGDLDGDGYPDLYVCHYCDWSFSNDPVCPARISGATRDVCPPQRFKPLTHALFRNEKGAAFRDISAEQGFKPLGCGLGVVLADLNQDGRPDVYVANDATDNFLFLNRGGRLEECARKSGVAADDTGKYNGSMGVDVGDYDGSGRPAIWVTNFQGELHALYHPLGKGMFDHRSRMLGIGAAGLLRVGFGTRFLDVDGDGWEDLVVLNGHVLRFPAAGEQKQKPVLFRNVERSGRRAFADESNCGGDYFQTPAIARGLGAGDLDNDGRPDMVCMHVNNAPVSVLRNVAADGHPWLGLQLSGRDHRDIVGSTVILECESRTLTRFVTGGGSYLSASDPRILIGLGTTGRLKRVTVKWSWGQSESWTDLTPGSYWSLAEGRPTAQPVRTSP